MYFFVLSVKAIGGDSRVDVLTMDCIAVSLTDEAGCGERERGAGTGQVAGRY